MAKDIKKRSMSGMDENRGNRSGKTARAGAVGRKANGRSGGEDRKLTAEAGGTGIKANAGNSGTGRTFTAKDGVRAEKRGEKAEWKRENGGRGYAGKGAGKDSGLTQRSRGNGGQDKKNWKNCRLPR